MDVTAFLTGLKEEMKIAPKLSWLAEKKGKDIFKLLTTVDKLKGLLRESLSGLRSTKKDMSLVSDIEKILEERL